MTLFYTDQYEFPLPAGHKFPLPKYRLLRHALEREGGFRFTAAPLADPDTVSLAHDPAYVAAFIAGSVPAPVMRRIGFPWSPELVRRTLASVGGTLAAADVALQDGIGGTLAGGTHHAFRGEGAGFCVFNDIAVAICSLRYNGRIRRAAVIDLDVHQGDGTAAIFADDPDVFTLSVHGATNFPFRKQTSRVDVALADGTGDEEYLAVVRDLLPRPFEFAPEIVFYQAGVDALATDRLGRLSLTHSGLRARDELVFASCRAAGVPCCITLGGGYAEPIEDTVRAHVATFVAARALHAG